jgi:SAM-dependent methyltransferase
MSELSKFSEIIGPELSKQVINLFDKISDKQEFEFSFFNYNGTLMSYEKYINVMKYLKNLNKLKSLPIVMSDMLDISYTEYDKDQKRTAYRISLSTMKNINKYMEMLHTKNNHVIMNILSSLKLEGRQDIETLIKTKTSENTIDIDDLNMRVKLSGEIEMSKKDLEKMSSLTNEAMINVSFRLKQRVSLYVHGDEKSKDFVRIDLTLVKSTKDINKINTAIPQYELEIECGKKSDESLKVMIREVLILQKILQNSNHIITTSNQEKVLEKYCDMLGINRKTTISLYGRNSYSFEIQHLEKVINKYAVTDKADGERNVLVIFDKHAYFISNNLFVRDTGISVKTDQHDGTIIDGELIFLPKKNRHIFLAFDCLFAGPKDMRKNAKLMLRLKEADNIINSTFVLKNQSGHKFEEYSAKEDTFDLKKRIEFHDRCVSKYISDLNSDIEQEKMYPLIRRKYFIDVSGAKSWEIFGYASLLYNKFTGSATKCPYMLDGIIFQPLEQEYIVNRNESLYLDLKWKPPHNNSIDFFIQFEKDPVTKKVLTIYDNSMDEYVKNKPYRICNLNVGIRTPNGEMPVLFKKEEELYVAYLFLKDGEVRDSDGNILEDNTVVEFYYNDDQEIFDNKFKWVPMRTRNDKTESVIRYRKKYGNYNEVANDIWRSINNPILISDFDELAKGENVYEKKMADMKSKISHALIISANAENVYYQVRTNLAKSMRDFHNWMKSILIYTYFHQMYEKGQSQTVLDLGCGRGGDIMKFSYVKCSYYVGLDIDKEGLISAIDGFESRYKQFKKKNNTIPPMYCAQADVGTLLNIEDQERVLGNLSSGDHKIYQQYFSNEPGKKVKFDRVNCSFALHYFLKNNETWNNFKTNLNNHLKHGGYFLFECFDADKLVELLKEQTFVQHYTNDKGERKVLFELRRNQEYGQKPYGVGNAIDLHAAWMFVEGKFETEYLVDKDFVIKELERDCELELLDTDTFDNQLALHENYLTKFTKYDDVKTSDFLGKVGRFYEKSEINEGCRIFTSLERFFVFRKKDKNSSTQHKQSRIKIVEKKTKRVSKKSQKGGNSKILNDLLNDGQFGINMMDENTSATERHKISQYENTFAGALHSVLIKHDIIPHSINVETFAKDYRLPLTRDHENFNIDEYANNFVISHIKNDKTHLVLNKVNIVLVEKNCSDDYFILDKNRVLHDKSILLYHDGSDNYYPIFRKNDSSDSKEYIMETKNTVVQKILK